MFTNRANATLYVPIGSKVAYEAANPWNEFKEIVETDIIDTGINTINHSESTTMEEVERYDASGNRFFTPQKGLNIVKYSNGALKKILIK